MAPVLALHGEQDEIVPVSEARKLDTLLRQRGVRVTTHILPGETHWFTHAARFRLLMLCSGFLAANL